MAFKKMDMDYIATEISPNCQIDNYQIENNEIDIGINP